MKQFFKYVFATVVGIMLTGLFTMIMFFSLVGIVASSQGGNSVKKHSVLRISLDGTINERASANPFAEIFGIDELQQQGLSDLLKAIEAAKENEDIAGIYLDGGALSTDYATAQELRQALTDFKQSKKFVIAYGDQYTQLAYYIATAADSVLLNPIGMLDLHGVASQPMFYKELLDKVGVKMQVFRVGTYKSAVEPYIATEMSEANREQVTSFCTDIWETLVTDIAKARKLSPDSLNKLVDNYILLAAPTDLLKQKLVDRLAYIDEVRATLRKLTGEEHVHLATAKDLIDSDKEVLMKASDHVAVYYAEGEIVDQSTSAGFGDEPEIVGRNVIKDLDELANDEHVKAVVLRVNSPGGSAYASEQMWRAVQLLREKKPVVVSMGGLAASGGYYLSCGADYIIAEPTTLTGSIGIFGLIPDVSGLLTEKLGLHFDVVKTNEAGDFGSIGRGFNEGESAAMQAYVERGYALFLSRVAEGRKKTSEMVDSIAQGRVWTGRQAKEIGLVDRIGTLEDAIAEATKRAKLDEPAVVNYPQSASWIDQLMSSAKTGYLENHLRQQLGVYYRPLRFAYSIQGRDKLQARIPFEPNLR